MKLQTARTVALAGLLIALGAGRLAAQRILNWPLRTGAGPDAVLRGAEAAFWNPAGVQLEAGRAEVLIADQRTPDAIGITGFAGAGAWRIDSHTTVAVAYQHVAIDDITETSTSPAPDGQDATFSIAEDQIAAAAARLIGGGLHFGALARFNRSNETGSNQNTTSLGVGFHYSPTVPLVPVLGAAVVTQAGQSVRYMAGVEVTVPRFRDDLSVRAGYGFRGGRDDLAFEHRFGMTTSWRRMLAVSGGVSTAALAGERSWEPVLGASLRVSRYELGVIREVLGNDFGAAYSFRFRIGLQ